MRENIKFEMGNKKVEIVFFAKEVVRIEILEGTHLAVMMGDETQVKEMLIALSEGNYYPPNIKSYEMDLPKDIFDVYYKE